MYCVWFAQLTMRYLQLTVRFLQPTVQFLQHDRVDSAI